MNDKEDNNIYAQLAAVQQELKAPKAEQGRFGKHRNVEGILEALKPVLKKHGLALVLDNITVQVGDRNYVEAMATVFNKAGDSISAKAQAWEGELSRGLDAPQVTGSASSYARKYALGGLFAIDDSKDPDSHMDDPVATKAAATPKPQTDSDPVTPAQKQQLRNVMLGLGMDKDAMEMAVQGALGKDKIETYGEYQRVLEYMENTEGEA